jgi:hypothetical protein
VAIRQISSAYHLPPPAALITGDTRGINEQTENLELVSAAKNRVRLLKSARSLQDIAKYLKHDHD